MTENEKARDGGNRASPKKYVHPHHTAHCAACGTVFSAWGLSRPVCLACWRRVRIIGSSGRRCA